MNAALNLRFDSTKKTRRARTKATTPPRESAKKRVKTRSSSAARRHAAQRRGQPLPRRGLESEDGAEDHGHGEHVPVADGLAEPRVRVRVSDDVGQDLAEEGVRRHRHRHADVTVADDA